MVGCGACRSAHLAALQVGRLPVFFKQHSCRFYSAWAFSVPQMVLRFPYSLAEATLWASIVYWIVSVPAQSPRVTPLQMCLVPLQLQHLAQAMC